MAADVQIRVWTGSAGSPTKTQVDGGNTRYHSADEHSESSNDNSILIPDSGTNYSFWKTLRLYINSISSGVVDNIRVYRDGSNGYGSGITEKIAKATSYVQATGTDGVSGTQLTTGNHAGLTGAPSDSFGHTSGDPLELDGSGSSQGDVGDFVVAQLEVGSGASSGTISSETLTFLYDDTSS